MKHGKNLLCTAMGSLVLSGSVTANAETLTDMMKNGKAFGDIRVRYEMVEQDNAVRDAGAMTARTRLGFTTSELNGFSATAEFEDVRIVGGIDKYTVGPTGFNLGEYSVIADPEVTELDQAFLQYKGDNFTAKLGRQVMTFDNHRFVGHVGWRQDRQTFDGAAFSYSKDAFSLNYNYIEQRNRIFAEEADIDSKDHLVNASLKLGPGKLSAYAYLLEVDNDTDNALDTYGLRYAGAVEKFSFAAEYATQTAEAGVTELDADYSMVELGYAVAGVNLKANYEVLGSDDGNYGFSTPLATLHKFNGWADVFLGTPAVGLEDLSATVAGKAGSAKWAITYHDFNASEGDADLGHEFDAVLSTTFGGNYNTGVKAAAYYAGDTGVDTTKIWFWMGMKF